MKQVTTIGINLAKNVFQVCVLGPSGQVKLNRQINHKQLLNTLRQYPEALIAMEACGSSHHWAPDARQRCCAPLWGPREDRRPRASARG